MLNHICPVCKISHEVRAVRAAFGYGRQLTCSPDCESERRKRMRANGGEEQPSGILHTWVVAKTHADFVRATDILKVGGAGRR